MHRAGERKARYEAEQEPWTWFHTCIGERRRREVVPVLDQLHAIDQDARGAIKGARGATRERREQLQERIHRFAEFSDEFVDLIDVFLAVGAGKMGKVFRSVARLMPKGRGR